MILASKTPLCVFVLVRFHCVVSRIASVDGAPTSNSCLLAIFRTHQLTSLGVIASYFILTRNIRHCFTHLPEDTHLIPC